MSEFNTSADSSATPVAETVPVRMGTRRGRFAALAGLSLAGLAGLGGSVATNTLAANLVYQGNTSQMSTTGLQGDRVGIAVVNTTRASASGSTNGTALRVGIDKIKLDGLCLSQQQSIAGVTYTIQVSAGDGVAGNYEISANDATFDVTNLRSGAGGFNMDGMVQIGVTADSLVTTSTGGSPDPNPLGAPTGPGWFGINSELGQFKDMRGKMYGFNVEDVAAMPGMKISISPGTSGGCDNNPIAK